MRSNCARYRANAEELVPFAAQSREEPVPYSSPPEYHGRHAVAM